MSHVFSIHPDDLGKVKLKELTDPRALIELKDPDVDHTLYPFWDMVNRVFVVTANPYYVVRSPEGVWTDLLRLDVDTVPPYGKTGSRYYSRMSNFAHDFPKGENVSKTTLNLFIRKLLPDISVDQRGVIFVMLSVNRYVKEQCFPWLDSVTALTVAFKQIDNQWRMYIADHTAPSRGQFDSWRDNPCPKVLTLMNL